MVKNAPVARTARATPASFGSMEATVSGVRKPSLSVRPPEPRIARFSPRAQTCSINSSPAEPPGASEEAISRISARVKPNEWPASPSAELSSSNLRPSSAPAIAPMLCS